MVRAVVGSSAAVPVVRMLVSGSAVLAVGLMSVGSGTGSVILLMLSAAT